MKKSLLVLFTGIVALSLFAPTTAFARTKKHHHKHHAAAGAHHHHKHAARAAAMHEGSAAE